MYLERAHPAFLTTLVVLVLNLHIKTFYFVKFLVGVLVTFFDQSVVIQAFFLTAAVVIGLTAFTFQTKHDFSNWYAALFTGILENFDISTFPLYYISLISFSYVITV